MIAKNIQKDHGKTGKIHAENTRIRCKMLKENHLNNIKGRASHVTFVKNSRRPSEILAGSTI